MKRVVSIDGTLVAPEEATVSVFDRGFLYGDSVFETVRTYGGEPFALADHLARLARSAELVGIRMPIPPSDLALEVRRAVRAARNAESYARIMITRGSGPLGLDPSLAERPRRITFVEPILPLDPAAYRDGVTVCTEHLARAGDAAPQAKIGNYLQSMLALRRAKDAGAHEVVILDAGGNVLEGTTSNVFAVHGGRLVTPPDDADLLQGITRAHLLDLAAELEIAAERRTLTVKELRAADEVFLSSTLREVLPVVRVDHAVVGTGAPGRVTRVLHEAFRRRVGVGADPPPWADPAS